MTAAAPARRRFAYGAASDRQHVDVFPCKSSAEPSPLLVYVHGGAWVSESVEEHYDLAALANAGECAVALVEYRLSDRDPQRNRIVWPDHLWDVEQALHVLASDGVQRECGYRFDGCTLVGHSAGAFMTLVVAMRGKDGSDTATPPLHARIARFVCVEGIYSLVDLRQRYPSYDAFLQPAFFPPGEAVTAGRLAEVGPESWELHGGGYYGGAACPRVWALHSNEDELLSSEYNERGVRLLRERLGVEAHVDTTTLSGSHDDVVHSRAFLAALRAILHDDRQ